MSQPKRSIEDIQQLLLEHQLAIAESCVRAQLHKEERQRVQLERERLHLEYLKQNLELPKIPTRAGGTS